MTRSSVPVLAMLCSEPFRQIWQTPASSFSSCPSQTAVPSPERMKLMSSLVSCLCLPMDPPGRILEGMIFPFFPYTSSQTFPLFRRSFPALCVLPFFRNQYACLPPSPSTAGMQFSMIAATSVSAFLQPVSTQCFRIMVKPAWKLIK